MTIIGASLVITGELTSEEDLAIDGRVEGPVAVRGGTVTIGKQASVESDVRATRVIIHGVVKGAVSATDRIELHPSATVAGSLSANQVVIEEGALFNGPIDMGQRTIAAKVAQYKAQHAMP
jgi:cytoskeletal protein CcmA (bactofilin family)